MASDEQKMTKALGDIADVLRGLSNDRKRKVAGGLRDIASIVDGDRVLSLKGSKAKALMPIKDTFHVHKRNRTLTSECDKDLDGIYEQRNNAFRAVSITSKAAVNAVEAGMNPFKEDYRGSKKSEVVKSARQTLAEQERELANVDQEWEKVLFERFEGS